MTPKLSQERKMLRTWDQRQSIILEQKKTYQEIAQNAFSKPCGSQRVKDHCVAAK